MSNAALGGDTFGKWTSPRVTIVRSIIFEGDRGNSTLLNLTQQKMFPNGNMKWNLETPRVARFSPFFALWKANSGFYKTTIWRDGSENDQPARELVLTIQNSTKNSYSLI